MGSWCSDTAIVFLGFSNSWASTSTELFEINIFLVYGLDTGLFLLMVSKAKVVLECASAVNAFYLWCQCFHSTFCDYLKVLKVLKKDKWCFKVVFCF